MFSSWKTSIVGLLLVAIGVAGLAFGKLDVAVGTPIIVAGLGFVAAKDHNVSGN